MPVILPSAANHRTGSDTFQESKQTKEIVHLSRDQLPIEPQTTEMTFGSVKPAVFMDHLNLAFVFQRQGPLEEFLGPCWNSQWRIIPVVTEDHKHPLLTFSLDPCAQISADSLNLLRISHTVGHSGVNLSFCLMQLWNLQHFLSDKP